MEKRKTGWLHPAHEEKKNGLVATMGKKKNGLVVSSPWRKRKMGWLHPAHGAKDHREKELETWTGFEKRRKGSRSIGDTRTGKKVLKIAGK